MRTIMDVKVIIDETMTSPQAFATSDTVVISQKFWDTLSPRQRMDVIVHEMLHAIYMHPYVMFR